MKLHTINTGYFKLDGGAMFGVVPKSIWNRLNTADENNMCNWAMRCLLIIEGNKKILIDTGIGSKQSDKFFGYYYLNGLDSLERSLNNLGLEFADITDVLLTHLHFDHCGGAVKWNEGKNGYLPTFPNAMYHISNSHWNHANNPNARERASFLPENYIPLKEAKQVNFVTPDERITENIRCRMVDGHTIGMICPEITYGDKTILYGADLYPSAHHVPLNYIMAYDIEPLKSMEEKHELNNLAVKNNWYIFYEHDPNTECSQIVVNDKGAFTASNILQLNAI